MISGGQRPCVLAAQISCNMSLCQPRFAYAVLLLLHAAAHAHCLPIAVPLLIKLVKHNQVGCWEGEHTLQTAVLGGVLCCVLLCRQTTKSGL